MKLDCGAFVGPWCCFMLSRFAQGYFVGQGRAVSDFADGPCLPEAHDCQGKGSGLAGFVGMEPGKRLEPCHVRSTSRKLPS